MLRLGKHYLAGLVREIGQHGLLFGRGEPLVPTELVGTVEGALPAVREYIANPVLPEEAISPGPLTEGQVALAIVAGARRAAEDAKAIEQAAAQVAREHGVTVRQLAEAAGITERAANDRYRRTYVFDPATTTHVPMRPPIPGAAEAGADTEGQQAQS